MGRELVLLVGPEVLVARLVHVLACGCPCLGLSLRLSNLGLRDVLGGLHVWLKLLLRRMRRGGLAGGSVVMLGLGVMQGLLLGLMLHLMHRVILLNGLGRQINVVVVIVTFGINLIAVSVTTYGGRCAEGHVGFDLDWAALPGLVHGSKLWWDASHGAASGTGTTGQWLLRAHTGN